LREKLIYFKIEKMGKTEIEKHTEKLPGGI